MHRFLPRLTLHTLPALALLLAMDGAAAQSWQNPIHLPYTNYAVYTNNTCNYMNTIHSYDFDLPSPGPDVAYLLDRRRAMRQPQYGAAVFTLYPLSFSGLDYEILACVDYTGVDALNCPYEADNVGTGSQPIQLVLPAADTNLHVIVTTGNLSNGGCGPYQLAVQRLLP